MLLLGPNQACKRHRLRRRFVQQAHSPLLLCSCILAALVAFTRVPIHLPVACGARPRWNRLLDGIFCNCKDSVFERERESVCVCVGGWHGGVALHLSAQGRSCCWAASVARAFTGVSDRQRFREGWSAWRLDMSPGASGMLPVQYVTRASAP